MRRIQQRKHMPTKVKFSDVYRHATGVKHITGYAKTNAKRALQKADLKDSEISEIIYNNEETSVDKMKKILGHLNEAGLHNFDKKSGSTLVDAYTKDEATRQFNIKQRMAGDAARPRSENLDIKPQVKPSARGRRVGLLK